MDKLTKWLDVLGCPYCRGLLQIGQESLHCATCDQRFPVLDGIPSLVRHENAMALANSARQYREARLREGWLPMTPDQSLALPYGSPPGYPPLYWEVRRESYEALVYYLSREGPSPKEGPVVDLGAGTGWLAHRLAETGYRVMAVETSLEEDFGLDAAQVYLTSPHPTFLPVHGDLEYIPVQRGHLSLAIFNASLHYARDLEETLRRAAETLKQDGRLIILDTPISRHADSDTHHLPSERPRRSLNRRELANTLAAAGLVSRWISIRRGPRWWIFQAKKWLKRETRFSFPMVIACRSG